MGRRGPRQGPGRGPAGPAVDRLLVVPLVPRHGARVVRGPRDRRRHERAVREREGRPRGAPRRGRPLHAGDPVAVGLGRLADDGLPDPGRPAVLRGHLLPEDRARRAAGLLRPLPGDRGRLPRPARGRRGPGRGGGAPPRRRRGAAGLAGRPRAAHPRGRRRGPRAGVRPPGGRLRRGPEVPALARARVPAAPPVAPARRPPRPRDGRADARQDGRGRHLRPGRRRVPPLQRRRPLAGAPLREDALRQRAARAGLRARLPRHRVARAPARGRRRRSTTCCASCACRGAGSARPRTPTRRGARARSSCGPRTSSRACCPPSRRGP